MKVISETYHGHYIRDILLYFIN